MSVPDALSEISRGAFGTMVAAPSAPAHLDGVWTAAPEPASATNIVERRNIELRSSINGRRTMGSELMPWLARHRIAITRTQCQLSGDHRADDQLYLMEQHQRQDDKADLVDWKQGASNRYTRGEAFL